MMEMASIAFFGKMPRAADFVRRAVSSPVMRNFENWFHDAYTELRGAGEASLAHPCHMILPHRNDADGVVAVLAVPSRDRIGREFPIVAATFVPRDMVPPRAATLMFGLTRYWESASSVIETHQDGEPEALWEALESLALPTAAELSEAEQKYHIFVAK